MRRAFDVRRFEQPEAAAAWLNELEARCGNGVIHAQTESAAGLTLTVSFVAPDEEPAAR